MVQLQSVQHLLAGGEIQMAEALSPALRITAGSSRASTMVLARW